MKGEFLARQYMVAQDMSGALTGGRDAPDSAVLVALGLAGFPGRKERKGLTDLEGC